MKRTVRLFPTTILIALFILSACAPASSSPTSEPESVLPTSTYVVTTSVVIPSATQPEVSPDATATLVTPTEITFIPTSRGPDLHATDPTTVNLASGQLQLVEFFRFT